MEENLKKRDSNLNGCRIRRPAGPTSGVMRVFVTVAADLSSNIRQCIVGIDLILAGKWTNALKKKDIILLTLMKAHLLFLPPPGRRNVARPRKRQNAFRGERIQGRRLRNPYCGKDRRVYCSRWTERLFSDLVFLRRHMGPRVYVVRH